MRKSRQRWTIKTVFYPLCLRVQSPALLRATSVPFMLMLPSLLVNCQPLWLDATITDHSDISGPSPYLAMDPAGWLLEISETLNIPKPSAQLLDSKYVA